MGKQVPWQLEERETLVRFDAIDNCWYISTNIQKHYSRFKKCGYELMEEELTTKNRVYYATFKVPFETLVSFRNVERALRLKESHKKKGNEIINENIL